MDDLVAFLNARIGEDEAVAQAAATSGNQFAAEGVSASSWRHTDHVSMVRSDAGVVVFDEGAPSAAQADHIARHDPARVLREVTAKRAILGEHAPDVRERGWCGRCRIIRDDEVWAGKAYPCPTLLHLAAVYSDHPDYREKWKP